MQLGKLIQLSRWRLGMLLVLELQLQWPHEVQPMQQGQDQVGLQWEAKALAEEKQHHVSDWQCSHWHRSWVVQVEVVFWTVGLGSDSDSLLLTTEHHQRQHQHEPHSYQLWICVCLEPVEFIGQQRESTLEQPSQETINWESRWLGVHKLQEPQLFIQKVLQQVLIEQIRHWQVHVSYAVVADALDDSGVDVHSQLIHERTASIHLHEQHECHEHNQQSDEPYANEQCIQLECLPESVVTSE